MVYVPALLLSLAASALAVTKNEPPALTYLFSANVTSGNATVVGQTPHGNRVVIPIVKGDVAGPKLNGQILGGTIATTYSSRGNNNADAVYTIRTDDGVNIMVTEKAHIPNINIWFETASEKYYWLNNVTAYAHEIPSKGVSNIHVYAIGSIA